MSSARWEIHERLNVSLIGCVCVSRPRKWTLHWYFDKRQQQYECEVSFAATLTDKQGDMVRRWHCPLVLRAFPAHARASAPP